MSKYEYLIAGTILSESRDYRSHSQQKILRWPQTMSFA